MSESQVDDRRLSGRSSPHRLAASLTVDRRPRGGRRAGQPILEPAEQPQQAVKDRQRMGRVAWDIEIDGKDSVDSVVDLRVAAKILRRRWRRRRRRSRS